MEIWPFEVLPGMLFQEQRSVIGRSSILHWSHILLFSTLWTKGARSKKISANQKLQNCFGKTL